MAVQMELIDADAARVVRRLKQSGFAAFLVGGCVRDLLLERTPKDFDVATSATPQEIKSVFRNCRIIGRRFRLAHVFFGPKIIETSTFRANPMAGETVESAELLIRRDNVFGTAEEDALRRDFTVNGLFFDPESDKLFDYVGGIDDLARRTVRTIGDPQVRFREDPVRILRAIKFAARLDFTIDPATFQAAIDSRGEIAKCAAPRVLEEVYRLLRGGAARKSVELLRETDVLSILFGEWATALESRPHPHRKTALRALWPLLGALDRAIAEKPHAVSNSVVLSVLALPYLPWLDLLDPKDDEGERHAVRDAGVAIDAVLDPIVLRLRAARRDSERAKQALLALRKLGTRRARPFRGGNLPDRDYFADAIVLREMVLRSQLAEPETSHSDVVIQAAELELTELAQLATEQAQLIRPAHSQHHIHHSRSHIGGHPGGGRNGDPLIAQGESTQAFDLRRRRRRGGRRRREPGQGDLGGAPFESNDSGDGPRAHDSQLHLFA